MSDKFILNLFKLNFFLLKFNGKKRQQRQDNYVKEDEVENKGGETWKRKERKGMGDGREREKK